MSRVWLVVMQDNEGNLIALDKYGSVVFKQPRTRPSGKNVKADKFSEELVTDVSALARFAITQITKQDHEESRF